MPSFCAAYGCSNNSHKEECRRRYVSFHAFPLNKPDLLQQWLFNMKRANFIPKTSSRLCSDHFEEDCFIFQNFTRRREVKKTAVPTKFSFKPATNLRVKKICDGRISDETSSTANSDQSDDASQSSSRRKRKRVKHNTSVDKPKVVIITCKPVNETEVKQSEDGDNVTEDFTSSRTSLNTDLPQSTKYSPESSFYEKIKNGVVYEDCEDEVERRHNEKMQRWDRFLGLMEQLVKNV